MALSRSVHGLGVLRVLGKLGPGCRRLLALTVLFSRGNPGAFRGSHCAAELGQGTAAAEEAGVHTVTHQNDLQQPCLEMARNNFRSS